MKKTAIVGTNETIGKEILSLLSENGTKKENIIAVAPHSTLGNTVAFGDEEEIDVHNLDGFDFSKVDCAIFCLNDELAKKYIPTALAQNIKIVDCSSAFLGQPDVPLIISQINDNDILKATKSLAIIPSAEVTQMLIPLQKIHQKYQITRLVVSIYNSASVYGKEGMDELFNQTRRIFMNESLADEQKVFKKQIAFNVIPQVGEFIGEETLCEWNFNAQTKQILGSQTKVHANCAIVPVFVGSGQYINVECSKEIDVNEARELIKSTKGVVVFDKQTDGGYVTLHDSQGENNIYISRLRQDCSVENGISFWCAADNLRAGVAQNAVSVLNLLNSFKNKE